MSQTPLNLNTRNQSTGALVPNQCDASGNLLVGSGSASALNVSAKTVIKAAAGRVCRVIVSTAGTVKFGVYDAATTGAAVTATAIYEVATGFPAAGTQLVLDFPCVNGIVVDPGTSGVVAVSFD